VRVVLLARLNARAGDIYSKGEGKKKETAFKLSVLPRWKTGERNREKYLIHALGMGLAEKEKNEKRGVARSTALKMPWRGVMYFGKILR